MKVLVTGGAGYIGSCVVEELLHNGYQPVILDTLLWGADHLRPLGNQIEIFEGDVRNSRDIVYALQNVDAVIHMAGIVGEPACKRNPLAHHTINVESTATLVNCMTDPDLKLVPDLIYASSCSVYGNVAGMYDEVTEDTPANPLSEYAAAKLRAEQLIFRKAEEVAHFHPTALRLTTLFGWSPRPRLDLVTNMFAYRAIRDGTINILGDGSQYRSLVHVRDAARAFVHVLNSPRFMRSRKIFHVGDEKNNRSIKEIAETTKRYVPDVEINFAKGAETDRRDYKISCQRIRSALNFEIAHSVEDGIQEMVENIRQRDLLFDPVKHGNATYDYR